MSEAAIKGAVAKVANYRRLDPDGVQSARAHTHLSSLPRLTPSPPSRSMHHAQVRTGVVLGRRDPTQRTILLRRQLTSSTAPMMSTTTMQSYLPRLASSAATKMAGSGSQGASQRQVGATPIR